MALLSEIIYTVRSLYARRPTDEEDFSDAQWEFLIDAWRAKLLRQQLSENRGISAVHLDYLELKLKRADPVDKLYLRPTRTYVVDKLIPQLLDGKDGECVTFIAENPLQPSFHKTSLDQLRYVFYNRLTGGTPKYLFQGTSLYVYSSESLAELMLEGCFMHPGKVLEFKGKRNLFAPYDFEYPLSETLLDTLYRGLADTEFNILKAAVLDLQNDGHTPTQQPN